MQEFFLTQEGSLIKRKVYTVFQMAENYGGMNGACNLVLAPLIAGIVARSFNYDLVTKHMKVKKRTSWNAKMPERALQ